MKRRVSPTDYPVQKQGNADVDPDFSGRQYFWQALVLHLRQYGGHHHKQTDNNCFVEIQRVCVGLEALPTERDTLELDLIEGSWYCVACRCTNSTSDDPVITSQLIPDCLLRCSPT